MTRSNNHITAIILAGGQGRRMGGADKGLLDFDGQPLVATLIEALAHQSVPIAINANRNLKQYLDFGFPVIPDRLGDYQGPLAGMAAAMAAVATPFILTLPCDGPIVADDYVARFAACQAKSGAGIVVADDGERLQPVHAMIATALLPGLDEFLAAGERKIDRWYAMHDFARVDFSADSRMFRNINSPEDRQRLESSTP